MEETLIVSTMWKAPCDIFHNVEVQFVSHIFYNECLNLQYFVLHYALSHQALVRKVNFQMKPIQGRFLMYSDVLKYVP